MPLSELVESASQDSCTGHERGSAGHSGGGERFYLRSVGANPRKEPAHLPDSFPDLAADIKLPLHLIPPHPRPSSTVGGDGDKGEATLFSSVLRIGSPGLRCGKCGFPTLDHFKTSLSHRFGRCASVPPPSGSGLQMVSFLKLITS